MVADRPGQWTFAVEAWSDPYSTWHHAVTTKIEAGQGAEDLANDLEDGARIFDRLAKSLPKQDRPRALAAAKALRDTSLDVAHRVAPALDEFLHELADAFPVRELVTSSPRYPLWIDRPRALFGSWYEFFPRSIGAELAGDPTAPARPVRHGTFKDATEHLDYVAALGFDVVYLPPIHPIGEVNRKGPNNTLVAASWDVGSPWAIGSREGGHDAIHPELGTMADFKALVKRANELGMEVALDLALQCAPDHPWVESHPEWFTTRPDGTIAYAENPPKKYQDIYPLNFDNDPKGLYDECLRIVRHWMDAGVRIFRVDNPHTKPINFWQWLIGEVRKTDPDVLFLAEAFTRPAMMSELAKVGFHQSYTYFTWRNTKEEIESYGQELVSQGALHAAELLHQHPGHPARLPGARRPRGVRDPRGAGGDAVADLRGLLRLRALRAPERAARQRGVPRLGEVPAAAARLRRGAGRRALARAAARRGSTRSAAHTPRCSSCATCASTTSTVTTSLRSASVTRRPATRCWSSCTVNPHEPREGMTSLDLPTLGLEWDTGFRVRDLLADGEEYEWGQYNYVRLDPHHRPAHVFQVVPL